MSILLGVPIVLRRSAASLVYLMFFFCHGILPRFHLVWVICALCSSVVSLVCIFLSSRNISSLPIWAVGKESLFVLDGQVCFASLACLALRKKFKAVNTCGIFATKEYSWHCYTMLLLTSSATVSPSALNMGAFLIVARINFSSALMLCVYAHSIFGGLLR